MQQYCLYLRKSRADIEAENKGEAETLARHERILLDLAGRMNLSVTQIYREVVSGETISARPVVQQLLQEVEQSIWTGVLVVEVERLARGDTIDQGIVARAFKMGEAKIITPVKVYDPNNEFDEEYFEFGLFMSRREYKTINRRIQRGRVASAKEGKAIISTPPYGYDKVRISGDKGYTLAPNENEARVVTLIYDLYNQGLGMTVIANKLDEMQIKPRNSEFWSKATISDILKNPVYIGKIRWSFYTIKKANVDGEIVKKRVRNNDYIYVDGLHPAITTQKEFDNAARLRTENTFKCINKDLSLKNPLSGVVYCRKCGSLMTRLGANHHVRYDTIKCLNKYCDNVSAPLSLVEAKVIEALKDWLKDYKLKVKRSSANADIKNRIALSNEALKNLRDEAKKIEKQISQTYDLVESGVYSVEVFTQRSKALAERRESILESISGTEEELRYEKKLITIKENAIPLIKDILGKYSIIDSAQIKNQLLKRIILRADYIKTEQNRRGNAYNENFALDIFPKLPN